MADGKERLQLTRALASRHIFMLSLGGVIGTGLFMGSGVTINQGGPAGAVLAYLVAGVLMYLVMVCLGELSVQMPVSGSFQAHATRFIGPATGFMIGWVYWMSWASTVGLEFTAAGMLMTRWFPEVPVWLWSGFFVVVLFSSMPWRPALSARPSTGSPGSRWRRSWCSSWSGAGDLRRYRTEERCAGADVLQPGRRAAVPQRPVGGVRGDDDGGLCLPGLRDHGRRRRRDRATGEEHPAGGAQRGVPRTDLLRAGHRRAFRHHSLATGRADGKPVRAGVRHGRDSLRGGPDELRHPHRHPLGRQLGPVRLDADPLGDVQDRHGPARPVEAQRAACRSTRC